MFVRPIHCSAWPMNQRRDRASSPASPRTRLIQARRPPGPAKRAHTHAATSSRVARAHTAHARADTHRGVSAHVNPHRDPAVDRAHRAVSSSRERQAKLAIPTLCPAQPHAPPRPSYPRSAPHRYASLTRARARDFVAHEDTRPEPSRRCAVGRARAHTCLRARHAPALGSAGGCDVGARCLHVRGLDDTMQVPHPLAKDLRFLRVTTAVV